MECMPDDVFKEKVIDYFANEYIEGRTPNPCNMCNKYLKFGAMYEKAKELDCEYIATGHYAKIEYDEKINAVLVKVEDKVIGELPDDESKELVKFLIMGHDVFSGRITRKKDDGNYNDMIKVAIYIKGREAMNIKEGSDK